MERGRKQTVKILGIMMLVLLFIGVWFSAGSVTAEAASTQYEKMDYYSAEKPIKVGKYYFKYTYDYDKSIGKWSYSKKKATGFKIIYKAKESKSSIVTDGKNVYYLKNNKLYRYNISKKTTALLKKLPNSKSASYEICAVYGKNVYVNKVSSGIDIYMYNTFSKKYVKEKKNFHINEQYGKYVIGWSEGGSYELPIYHYTLTSSGLSKGKKLATYGLNADFVNGKLYYGKSDKSGKKATLYRAKANASSKKILGKFTASGKNGQVSVYDFHAKYCKVFYYGDSYGDEGKEYKYVYNTKKKTLVK